MAESGIAEVSKVIEGFEEAKDAPNNGESKQPEKQSQDRIPLHVLQAQERVYERSIKALEGKIQSLEEKLADNAPKKRETEMEQAIAEARKKWQQDELEPLRTQIQDRDARMRKTNLQQAIMTAKPREEVNIDHVAKVLDDYFHDSDDFGTVLYLDGQPVVSPKGTADRPYMGFAEGVDYLASRPEFTWAFRPRNMVGSPGYAGGSKSESSGTPPAQYTRTELASSPAKMAAFMEAERQAGRNPRETLQTLPKE